MKHFRLIALAGALATLWTPNSVFAQASNNGPRADKIVPKSGAAVPVVRLRLAHRLAQVGGTDLTWSDLAPVPKNTPDTEQIIPVVEFNSLLDRAIERVVVLQAAATAGIGLSPQQKTELDEFRGQLTASDPNVIKELTRTDESVAFELREVTALMLINNLAAKAGVPSPHVTGEDIQNEYLKNKKAYGELPNDQAQRDAAWRKLEPAIRKTVADRIRDDYGKKRQKFLDDLKAKVKITKVTF